MNSRSASILAGLSAAAVAASLLGPMSRLLDSFSHLTPLYVLLAGLALAFGRSPPRQCFVVATSLFALAGAGLIVAPEFIRDSRPPRRLRGRSR